MTLLFLFSAIIPPLITAILFGNKQTEHKGYEAICGRE